MRIAILSIGSEGDVRPYIALGRELQSDEHASPSHEVHLVTHVTSRARVEAAGLRFADIGKDPVVELRESELGTAVADAGTFGKIAAVKAYFTDLVEDWFQKGFDALKAIDPDFVVLGTFPMNLHSLLCSDVLRVPFCQIHLMPIIPTAKHAPPVGFGSAQTTFKFMAKLKWKMSFAAGYSLLYSAPLSKAYAPHGVSISSSVLSERWESTPAVLGYSTVLSPRPSDYDGGRVKIVGPLADSHSEDDAAAFVETSDGRKLTQCFSGKSKMDGGKPVVFVGFGSMWETLTNEEKVILLREIIDCARALENETHAIIVQCDEATVDSAGYSAAVGEVPGNFVTIQGAPHSWLFPQVDIVICHGGSGTVHKAVMNGCATIVCSGKPDDSDQPFWAGCIVRAGLGTAGPNMKEATSSKLEKCVRRLLGDTAVKGNVRAAAEVMKKQDGVKNGARAVLHFASSAITPRDNREQ